MSSLHSPSEYVQKIFFITLTKQFLNSRRNFVLLRNLLGNHMPQLAFRHEKQYQRKRCGSRYCT